MIFVLTRTFRHRVFSSCVFRLGVCGVCTGICCKFVQKKCLYHSGFLFVPPTGPFLFIAHLFVQAYNCNMSINKNSRGSHTTRPCHARSHCTRSMSIVFIQKIRHTTKPNRPFTCVFSSFSATLFCTGEVGGVCARFLYIRFCVYSRVFLHCVCVAWMGRMGCSRRVS